MANLIMTPVLLDTICAILDKKSLAINESRIGLLSDWRASVKDYFYALPDRLTRDIGLSKNLLCFEAIVEFNISDEMLNALPEDISNFSFSYPGTDDF